MTATSETTVATTIDKSYGELRNTDTAHVQEILNEHVEKQQNGEQQNAHNQNCIEMAIEEVEVIEEQNELPNGQIEGNEENEGMVMETEEHQTISEEESPPRHEDEEAISMDMIDPFLMSIHAYRYRDEIFHKYVIQMRLIQIEPKFSATVNCPSGVFQPFGSIHSSVSIPANWTMR